MWGLISCEFLSNSNLGGGKARDKADFHCKELYRCYKCLGIDFNATHADMAEMEYKVNLSIDKRGNKEMTCEGKISQNFGWN